MLVQYVLLLQTASKGCFCNEDIRKGNDGEHGIINLKNICKALVRHSNILFYLIFYFDFLFNF